MQRLALWTSCVAQLIVVLDISVVNVALPSIQADLELGTVAASWVAMAYNLGFAGLLLVGARLADVVGTARLLAWSVGAFTVASLIGGLATEGWVLIAARAAQGVSAAAASPATFTLLTATHDEGAQRTRAIAVWTAVSLAGGGLGNIVSGGLTDLISWRATLVINLPIGVGVSIAALVLRRRSAEQRGAQGVDLRGALLATAAFTCAAYAVSVVGEGVEDGPSFMVGAAAAGLFMLLGCQQRRARHTLVPRRLLGDRLIILGTTATALTGACFQVGLWYFLTFRMQAQLGYSPTQAGLAFVPLTASMLVVNLWATPFLLARRPAKAIIVAGVVFAAPGLVWLAALSSGPFVVSILAPTIAIGVGGGLMSTPLATLVTTGVGRQDAGAASALLNTAKQFGGTVGLAAASTTAATVGTDGAAFALMAVALLMAMLVVAKAPHRVDTCG